MHRITGAQTAASAAASVILLSAALFVRYALAADEDPGIAANPSLAAATTAATSAGGDASTRPSRSPELSSATGLANALPTR
jgi:hypothetical protein